MRRRERDDYTQYAKAWRSRLAQREARRQAQMQQLRQVARDCAHRLVAEFGVKKVYLFGSLAEGDWVHDRSDIDLAVEGLAGELYFEALAELWELLPSGVELDLVPLEHAWPGLAERVRDEGVVLDADD